MAGLFQGFHKSTPGTRPSPTPQDQSAAAALYDRTAAQVFGLVKAIVGDDGTAQDITAHVYRQAWQAAVATRPPAEGAQSWLVARAHRQAAEYLRTHVSIGIAESEQRRPFLTAPALEQLDAPSRDLLVLVYYRGYTCSDAAVLLGLSADTVHSRLVAALRDLARASDGARESTSSIVR